MTVPSPDLQTGPATAPAEFLVDNADTAGLRAALAEISRTGYSESAARDRLGLDDLADLRWKALPIYRSERLAERDALASAIDLFLLQGAIPEAELHRILTAPSRDVLVRSGVLVTGSKSVTRARATLFPVGERLIFSDHAWHKLPHPGYTRVPSDQVMFIGSDSRWLARATVRRPARAALDLCTGSGIHALLASAHSERVLAVDINPRAVRCARFNAQVSASRNVEVVLGDLYGAVPAGERFDLITANPPFVPSPVEELMFRDGGRSGEEIQQRVVAGFPQYLAAGGIAQMVTELGEGECEPIEKRVRHWLGGAPMDIHILRLRAHSAADYAIGHANGDGGFGDYLESVGAWAGNLRAHGYARVVLVLIAFEWSDPSLGPPWDRVDEARPPRREAGDEVEAAFSAERLARKSSAGAAFDRDWIRRSGPIALFESQVLGAQLHAPARATLLGQALAIEHHIDPFEREILYRLHSPMPVSQLLAIARESKIDAHAIIAAIDSLRRRRLVAVFPGLDPPAASQAV